MQFNERVCESMVETKEHIFTFSWLFSTWRQSNRQYTERQMQTANILVNGRHHQRHSENEQSTQHRAMHHIVIRIYTMQSYELLINVFTVEKTENHTINLVPGPKNKQNMFPPNGMNTLAPNEHFFSLNIVGLHNEEFSESLEQMRKWFEEFCVLFVLVTMRFAAFTNMSTHVSSDP